MSTPARPHVRLEMGWVDRLGEAAAATGVLATAAILLAFWPELPEEIPHHFDARGTPDRWGGHSVLWLLGGMILLFYAGVTILQRFPRVFNYPWAITESNAQVQFTLAVRLLRWLKAAFVWTFFATILATCRVATGRSAGLPWMMPFALVVATFGITAVYFVAAWRAR